MGVLLAAVGLLVSLWPMATSLYDLTGEEVLLAQVRGMGHWVNTAVRPILKNNDPDSRGFLGLARGFSRMNRII